MPRKSSRRAFGAVRRLPSGRWQAHYTTDSGERRTAPITFETKDKADGWLATIKADMLRGTWRDPLVGDITLERYFKTWMDTRPKLKDTTRDLYERLGAHWLLPRIGAGESVAELGPTPLRRITTKAVREWNAIVVREARTKVEAKTGTKIRRHPAREWARAQGIEVPKSGRLGRAIVSAWEAAGSPDVRPAKAVPVNAGQTTAAQAYRLLHAIMATAVEDDLIPVNPCTVKNAASVRHAERVPATPYEVEVMAEAAPRRYRAAVLLAAWSGLRAGEEFALYRRHIDIKAATVRVEQEVEEIRGQPVRIIKSTKTEASVRTVALPRFVADALAEHLDEFVSEEPDAKVFASARGNIVRNATRSSMFRVARAAAGRDDLTWHDLRHTGADLAYDAGASVKQVQRRLGHASNRAAQIYAHANEEKDRTLADNLDQMETARRSGMGNVVPFPKVPAQAQRSNPKTKPDRSTTPGAEAASA